MATRSREWLRSFLRLDARAASGVSARDIERQEDTVLRALELLDVNPGVVLADEVGMGKTYEALGVVAARRHLRPDARTLILTPGPDLNTKWMKEIRAFGDPTRTMFGGFEGHFREAWTLADVVDAFRHAPIVVAPNGIFASNRTRSDQAYLLSLWADEAGLGGNQVAAIFRRYREGTTERVACAAERLFGVFDWETVRPIAAAALRAHRKSDDSLDARLKGGGYDAFANSDAVDRALSDLRFRLMSSLLPDLDLLVVDEAHKLKNPGSVRSRGVSTTFDGKFDRALFLTATPFQLTVEELDQVFSLFGRARGAPPDMAERAERLLADVRAYQAAYAAFFRAWGLLDAAGAKEFEAWFDRDRTLAGDPREPALRRVVELARPLLRMKHDRVEPGFRAWMIRSLREDKRLYRRAIRTRLQPRDGAGVPFLLYERFIAELFRSKARTHKAAVQINMVSSYGAARTGALLSDDVTANLGEAPEGYRRMLKRVVGDLRDARGGHPKVAHVAGDALAAAGRGEKTLIFCTRVETLHELKREIEAAWSDRMLERWRRVYPGALETDIFDETTDESRVRGRHSKLQVRFRRGQDALYLALRERYVATRLDASEFAEEHLDAVVHRANAVLAKQHVSKLQAERVEWRILKRCVEHAVALELRESGDVTAVEPDALRRIADPSFVALGYDLERDDVEDDGDGSEAPSWRITADEARLVIARDHLWDQLQPQLDMLPSALRVRTVERLSSYLASRHVSFLPELLEYARDEGVDVEAIESRVLLPVVDRFWSADRGRPWRELLRRFLLYARGLDEARREEVLDDVVKRATSIVRHTVDGESRERLREAFNTPLYPMILVANEVMQEGLDLHHHCRSVVHHDLAWNPAQLEQRVGRVDRIGSLVQRLRERDATATLDVLWPLIANTIDERLERTVKLRERWLEFLLGAPPKVDEGGLADEPGEPLPSTFSDALRVDLGPRG